MEFPEGFDLEALLAPLPGESPAGLDLREDFSPQSAYFRLRDARAEARDAERTADAADIDQAGGGQDAAVPMPWRTVRELAGKVLAGQSKDLEVAAWLTEALVRFDGLRGLAAGARLIGGLADAFWDSNLYPMPDEDGIATRVAPIAGLNGIGGDGTLTQPLRKVALWQRPDGSKVGFWQYEQSAKLEGISDPARLEARQLALQEMEKEARAAAASLALVREEAAAALQAWEAMTAVLDARAGVDSPPTSRIRDLLQQMQELAQKYAPTAPAETAVVAAAPATATGGAALLASVPALAPAGNGAATREDMLRELARIAEFFRMTEPHSPLAYTLDEAVRRGRMSWPQLLEEIVPDPMARGAIQTALGIRPPEAS